MVGASETCESRSLEGNRMWICARALRGPAIWILKRAPDSQRGPYAQYPQYLQYVARSACTERAARFAGHHRHRAGHDPVWRAERDGHGGVCIVQGKAVAAIPWTGAWGSQSRYVQ